MLTRNLIRSLGMLCTIALNSCGDDSERYEQIAKLRAIGVEQSPVIAQPGSVVTLTFHLAAPQGKTITASAYNDTVFRYGSLASVTLLDAAPTEQKFGSISDYTLRAQFTVPSNAVTMAAIAKSGSLRMRYGVAFNDGERNERVVGDTLVYAADAAEQTWTAPTISLDQPLTESISSTTTLSSTIHSTINENNRVSWFVSSGKVKNRRAKATEWSEIGTGEQTVIVTMRGAKSGAFAVKAMKVTVQ